MAAAEGAEQVTNGSLADGLTGWTNYPNPSVTNGQGCIDVPAHAGAYAAAISQKPIAMTKDTSYARKLAASVTPGQSRTIRAAIQAGQEQNYARALPEKVLDLTSSAKAYSFTSSSAYDIPKAELAIKQSTDNPSAYRLCVDDVSLTGGAEPEVYRPDAGPRARVNQVAYLPGGPKAATLVTERTTPVTWALKIAAGKVVASGRTTPRGVDPSAGLNAHSIEFGRFNRRGTGYTLVADGETSYRFDTGTKAYEALRRDSKSFFYTQRCGIAIDDALVPGSRPPAGDSGVTPNKGDTAVPCQDLADDSQRLYDKPWTCDYTTDVSGGWYDAVDHGKYVSTVEFRWRS